MPWCESAERLSRSGEAFCVFDGVPAGGVVTAALSSAVTQPIAAAFGSEFTLQCNRGVMSTARSVSVAAELSNTNQM